MADTKPSDVPKTAAESQPQIQTRTVAVVEVGTASVRLAVAQVGSDGSIQPLDSLLQAVPIGRDTFIRGEIRRETIEECVRVLSRYRTVMAEYDVTRDDQIHTVATSAVREAANCDAFVDRVFMATGLTVEPLEESDIIRMTYLGLYTQLVMDTPLSTGDVVVAAMEGGSTDVFLLEKGRVALSRNYRLGSVRLQKMLETYRAPAQHEREIMEDHVCQTVDVIRRTLPPHKDLHLLAIGAEARFAAAQLVDSWDQDSLVRIPLSAYSRLAGHVIEMTDDQIAREYGLSLAEAETLAPALSFYLRLARTYKVRQITVSGRSMRTGVLLETARRGLWVNMFGDQIVEPAKEVARKYGVNEPHADHVAKLARSLFGGLKDIHKLGSWHELLLTVAAVLHEVGQYVSERSHHKHTMYIIQNSDLFGLSPHDRLLVALIARYHRRASPKPVHLEYASLDRDDRLIVLKLAAILRVADALDRSYSQRVQSVKCVRESGRLVVETPGLADVSLETLALRGKGSMFQDVYGMDVIVRTGAQEAV